MITKDDFLNWKHTEVTKTVFAMIEDRIEQTRTTLGEQAGENPLNDKYLVGYIKGLQEFLYMSVDEVEVADA